MQLRLPFVELSHCPPRTQISFMVPTKNSYCKQNRAINESQGQASAYLHMRTGCSVHVTQRNVLEFHENESWKKKHRFFLYLVHSSVVYGDCYHSLLKRLHFIICGYGRGNFRLSRGDGGRLGVHPAVRMRRADAFAIPAVSRASEDSHHSRSCPGL